MFLVHFRARFLTKFADSVNLFSQGASLRGLPATSYYIERKTKILIRISPAYPDKRLIRKGIRRLIRGLIRKGIRRLIRRLIRKAYPEAYPDGKTHGF